MSEERARLSHISAPASWQDFKPEFSRWYDDLQRLDTELEFARALLSRSEKPARVWESFDQRYRQLGEKKRGLESRSPRIGSALFRDALLKLRAAADANPKARTRDELAELLAEAYLADALLQLNPASVDFSREIASFGDYPLFFNKIWIASLALEEGLRNNYIATNRELGDKSLTPSSLADGR